jgi:periplasmic protein TonB
MNAKVNIFTNEWCNLVFEGKNKEYGAYEIRQQSSNQYAKAILFSLLLISASAVIPFLKKAIVPVHRDPESGPTILQNCDLPVPPDPIKMDVPPTPAARPTIEFAPPVITDEQVTSDLATQENVLSTRAVVWTSTMTGDDLGVDPEAYRSITGEAPKETIFVGAQQMPEFPGGTAELMRFLQKNIHYPSAAIENQISGKVYIQFVVNKLGEIRDIKVIRGLEGGCTEEALRVIKKMPNWKPAKNNGDLVSVYFSLPIVFALSE